MSPICTARREESSGDSEDAHKGSRSVLKAFRMPSAKLRTANAQYLLPTALKEPETPKVGTHKFRICCKIGPTYSFFQVFEANSSDSESNSVEFASNN